LQSTPAGDRLEWSAAVWDSAPAVDHVFFNEEIWPIIASLRVTGPGVGP
jgi:hypothetical protein